MANKGILLGEDGDVLIRNKSVVIGNSLLQEVAVILQSNQGDFKYEPLLGTNLIQLKKTNISRFDIEKRARVNLLRDGKNYDQIKHLIQTVLR